MSLDSAAATAAATAYADALIVTYPAVATHRDALIAAKAEELLAVFTAITAHAVVDPVGTPKMVAGGDDVTGKGKLT